MAAFDKLLSLFGSQAVQVRQFKNSPHITVANPWHAVGIVTQRPGCPVCGPYKGVRFLAHEAPPLPLRNCPDPKSCNTVYKHYKDRRAGPRRADEVRALSPMTPMVSRTVRDNRRSATGRRRTDH